MRKCMYQGCAHGVVYWVLLVGHMGLASSSVVGYVVSQLGPGLGTLS
jgi:hypothetical protein